MSEDETKNTTEDDFVEEPHIMTSEEILSKHWKLVVGSAFYFFGVELCFNILLLHTIIYTAATGHDPIDFEGDAKMDVLHDDLHPVLHHYSDCLLVLARSDPYRSLVIRLPFADLAASSLSLR